MNIWLKNNKPFKDRAVFRLSKKILLRRVIATLRADDIHDTVLSEHPDAKKGDKEYPGLFQKALTEYMESLDDEQKEEFEKTREEWQTKSHPREVQLK